MAAHNHGERATFLRAMADGLRERTEDFAQMWPRESGALHSIARFGGLMAAGTFDYYAGLADTYPFEEAITPTMGGEWAAGAGAGWRRRSHHSLERSAEHDRHKGSQPALLSGCTIVVKSSPEAPGEGYLVAEIAGSRGPSGRGVERPDGRPRGV